ncbi:TPA: hypothetical protein EYN98_21485 [Candidatus Poribacteria bacterium]|nr:hypothetical protein [Candidatus Poribacteria bacterium]
MMSFGVPDKIESVDDSMQIERCDFERDLPNLIAVYDQFNAIRIGTMVRDETYWQVQPEWRGQDPDLFWIVKQEGKIAAYLKGGGSIREFGYLPDCERSMISLLVHFFKYLKLEGIENSSVDDIHESQQIFGEIGCEVSESCNNSAMFRITNFASILQKATLILEDRLRNSNYSDWQGTIRIRYELDDQMLIIENGIIQVSAPITNPTIDLDLTQIEVLQLIFGDFNTDYDLISILFPLDELLLWDPDNF